MYIGELGARSPTWSGIWRPSLRSRLAIIALHLALALPLAYLLNIWMDEASSLYTTRNGLVYAFQNAAGNEEQAPLYFWILSLWRLIDGSIFFARLLSVLFSALSIWVFSNYISRFLGPRGTTIATAFFAFHPLLIWASLEIRVYSLLILLSLLLVKFFSDGFLESDQRISSRKTLSRVLFLITAIVALYTNYYLGFLLLALFVPLVALRRWGDAGVYLCLMALTALAFGPLALEIQSQFETKTSGFIEPRSIVDGVRMLWHHFLTFVLPTGVFPDLDESLIRSIRVWTVRIALAGTLVIAIKQRKDLTQQTFVLFIVLVTVGLCMIAAYYLMGSQYIAIRHATVLFIPVLLFLASLAADLLRKRSSRTNLVVISTIGCLVVASFAYSLINQYPSLAKRGDWARVGSYIAQNESPGQPIIVFTVFEALALPNHYQGVNRILPDERFFEFEVEAEVGSTDRLKRQIDFVISKIPPEAESIWLLLPGDCAGRPACVPLENYVQANYTIEKEKEFYLERVFLLRKKSQ